MTDAAIAREAARAYPRWLSVETLISYLDLGSSDAAYRLVQDGLPASRIGSGKRARFRFDRYRVDAWLAEREVHVASVDRSHVLNLVARPA